MLALVYVLPASAQDPQFSQYYANKLWLSPAFAGSGIGPRFITSFRSQWSGIPGAFRTFSASFDAPIYFGNVQNGIGFSVLADQAGDGALTTLQPLFNYAFLVELSNHSGLRFGLSAGLNITSIDFFALRFPDQLQAGSGGVSQEFTGGGGLSNISNNNRVREEVGAGVIYYNRYLFAGATIKHITQPEQRLLDGARVNSVGTERVDTQLPRMISGFAGGNIPLDPQLKGTIMLTPTVLYRVQGPFSQVDVGTYFKFDYLSIGAYYRALGNDAIIGIVGIDYNNLRIGYSYDYTTSQITNRVSGGSHEISLSYELEQKRKRRKPKPKLTCPNF
ncbi:MAG: PorP/SprF family type IX secretion system membrane protein [Sphingobacteriia bacterium]